MRSIAVKFSLKETNWWSELEILLPKFEKYQYGRRKSRPMKFAKEALLTDSRNKERKKVLPL